jgi:ribosome-associated protein
LYEIFEAPMPLTVTPEIELQDWEMTEVFVRASGPGGQNVNKVSSAVELRFEAERSPSLPGPVKARLRRLAGRRWTKEGAVVIQVSEERSQARNREIARERLASLLRGAAARPKRRVKTTVSRNQKRKRVEAKKQRGAVKAMRAAPEVE